MKLRLIVYLFSFVMGLTLIGCGQQRMVNQEAVASPPAVIENHLRITVDLAAYKLTLWENGQPVRSYKVGIGRRAFPTTTGTRKATSVVWNPDWVPPASVWVKKMRGVKPGERIRAGDRRNPLGEVKIPLGEGYLIHEASRPTDIGRRVSHGCVRMRRKDLLVE